MTEQQAKAIIKRAESLHETLGKCDPKLSRGIVWCTVCGRSEGVNSASCFKSGWPKCCGYTMTIDSPEERAELAKRGEKKS